MLSMARQTPQNFWRAAEADTMMRAVRSLRPEMTMRSTPKSSAWRITDNSSKLIYGEHCGHYPPKSYTSIRYSGTGVSCSLNLNSRTGLLFRSANFRFFRDFFLGAARDIAFSSMGPIYGSGEALDRSATTLSHLVAPAGSAPDVPFIIRRDAS